MRSQLASSILAAALVAVPGRAAEAGYFDTEDCVDSSGMERCYKEADATYANCITDFCAGDHQTADCPQYVCACTRTEDYIDCNLRHCWNQVYSCECQATVTDLGANCLNPHLENVPFTPAPENAAGRCSCNLGQVSIDTHKAPDEFNSCGGDQLEKLLATAQDSRDVMNACSCCMMSKYVSSMFQVCPNTDPEILGFDLIMETLGKDDLWPNCREYMDEYPCEDPLLFSPPGGNAGNKFYAAGELPPAGTETLYNTNGQVTAFPTSASVVTWSRGSGTPHTVTLKQADAKPTGSSGGKDNKSSKDGDSQGGNNNNNGGDGDKHDAAAAMAPRLLFVTVPLMLAGFVML